jgi:hypothetical protein
VPPEPEKRKIALDEEPLISISGSAAMRLMAWAV